MEKYTEVEPTHMSQYYPFIGNNIQLMYSLRFNCEGEVSTSVYMSIYAVSILPNDGRYNRPKHIVEYE
jgi:hypothetical protein